MKKQYAVACAMAKNDGTKYRHTTTLHINEAESPEEAKGMAVDISMKMNQGYSVAHIVATEIPQPSNGQGNGLAATNQTKETK